MRRGRIRTGGLLGLVLLLALAAALRAADAPAPAAGGAYLSPGLVTASPDGKTVYAACVTAKTVAVVDLAGGKVARTVALPATPTGLALSADGTRLYATCASPAGVVCAIDTASGAVGARIPAGHGVLGPALSPDGKTLYVCNRFDHAVSAIDLAAGKETWRAKVVREPVSAAPTADGKALLVANHLPAGPADADRVAAVVSVLDAADGKAAGEIELPNGSTAVREIRLSPDGKLAAVTHALARFHLPTTQLDRGWMSTNAVTLVDAQARKGINTVLLDNIDRGAANPWGVAWSADGKTLVIAHAGTHEVSVIDVPGVLAKLAKLPEKLPEGKAPDYTDSPSRIASDVPNDLSFLVGLRRRIPVGARGPRGVVVAGTRAVTANYFSDSLSVVDLAAPAPAAAPLPLGPAPVETVLRKGEALFSDATICFQGWQSCATCHDEDGRIDGLNWDLLNDGIGNPKNTKTMLLSHQTPPAMSMGIREKAETAVRSGIRVILFSVRPEEEAVAMDEFLKALKPVPSPALVDGKLSEAARRGEKLFNDTVVGCANCHPAGLSTDLKHHDVGTRGKFDKEGDLFDTPALIEVWRTAPYLHDGSAVTLRDVLTVKNKGDRHGKTSQLTKEQIEDLLAFLMSQ
jgi:DNA-binding beta-propeller fold protein YncE